MLSENNKITVRQMQILLILDIFGMGITILPRKVVEFGGENGFIIIILSLFLILFATFLINKVTKLYPNKNFVDYSCIILGKPLGMIISVGFITKIILNISLQLRIFSEIIKEIILFNTPIYIIMLCMLLLGAYCGSKGIETRGRLGEILIYLVLIPLIFVFSLGVIDADFTNLLPILKTDTKMLFLGSYFISFYFSGVELLLLMYPYIQNQKKVQKASMISVVTIGIIILFICVITLSKFGKYDLEHQMWPVLEMMNTIDLPGSFLERQDALIMSFWIISIFMIISGGLFFSSILSKAVIKKGSHRLYILIFIPIVYIISFIPDNIIEIYKFMDLNYLIFGTVYIFLIPVILLLIYKFRKLGETNESL